MSECSICGKAILYPGTNYAGAPDAVCHGHFFPKPPSNIGNVASGPLGQSQVIGSPLQGLPQGQVIGSPLQQGNTVAVMEQEIRLAAIREAKSNLVQAIKDTVELRMIGDANVLAREIEELIVQYMTGH